MKEYFSLGTAGEMTLQTVGNVQSELEDKKASLQNLINLLRVGIIIVGAREQVGLFERTLLPNKQELIHILKTAFPVCRKGETVLAESRWAELLWVKCKRPDQEATLTLEFQLKACETVGAVQPI